ncbi:MAG: hypothetical protein ACR5K7_00985 [Symbiopectobacterium sp.]
MHELFNSTSNDKSVCGEGNFPTPPLCRLAVIVRVDGQSPEPGKARHTGKIGKGDLKIHSDTAGTLIQIAHHLDPPGIAIEHIEFANQPILLRRKSTAALVQCFMSDGREILALFKQI